MNFDGADQAFLDELQRNTFRYFTSETNPDNGLVRDSARDGSHASIASVGMALACYPVGVERGYMSRTEAVGRTLTTLQFLLDAPQNEGPEATGYRGLFYHFLDMDTGRRGPRSELSTVDSAILFAGALTAARYFDLPTEEEAAVRALADALYRRAEWSWFVSEEYRVALGWRPRSGFLPYHWGGYNEALILLFLALGSPTHPIDARAYPRWLETYRWKAIYGHEFLYCGPLFTHQLSHAWVDFRGIQDEFMRSKGIDYFENSRRATLVQREYARRNPRRFRGYSEDLWGISAGDGPGPTSHEIDGVQRRFWGYRARGVPWGPDDGTLSPWAMAASLPFLPAEVVSGLRTVHATYPTLATDHGFAGSVNATYPGPDRESTNDRSPVGACCFGVDQGPVVLMIENARSELIWSLMKACPYVVRGLERAGFGGGWLAG